MRAPQAMKLALLSESPADEAALSVLVGYVLGAPFTRVQPTLRARGWPSVEQVLPAILRHLHFNTEADGLIVVVDSDDSARAGIARRGLSSSGHGSLVFVWTRHIDHGGGLDAGPSGWSRAVQPQRIKMAGLWHRAPYFTS